ncbi:hypothetical protein [Luethyella okanaganae]|uniref:Ig-like domain-containing protein n=1 Tax=Luethyella okanaganae TaxID=69372 RepID=A0ABW1VIB1_9MICO
MPRTRRTLSSSLTAAALITGLTIGMPTGAYAANAGPALLAPSVTTQPASATAVEAEDAGFTIAFIGGPEPTVQWERSDDEGATWEAIQGANNDTATTDTLALTGVTTDDSGAQFRASVVNDGGAVTSEAATLTVTPVTAEVPDGSNTDAPDASATAPASMDVDASAPTGVGNSPQEVETSDSDGAALTDGARGVSATAPDVVNGKRITSPSALASSATPAPGTYTITANPYVPPGVSATVSAEVGALLGVSLIASLIVSLIVSLIASLQRARLDASRSTTGDEYELATAAFVPSFVTIQVFEVWSINQIPGFQTVDLAGQALASVSPPTDHANPLAYLLSDGTREQLRVTTVEQGEVAFETRKLGTIVVIDGDSGTAWQHTKTFASDVGTTMSYWTTGKLEASSLRMGYDTLDALGLFSSFLGEESSTQREAETIAALRDDGDYTDPEVHLYTFGLDMSLENLPHATTAKRRSFMLPLGNGKNSLSGTVPVGSSDDSVYLVSGTVGEGITVAVKLDEANNGTTAAFDLVNRDENTLATGSMPQRALWNAATGKSNDIDTEQTEDTEIAYVVVVHEAPTLIEKPNAAEGLVYDGTTQIGLTEREGHVLSIAPSATDAGDYVAQSTLKDGHV